MPKSFDFTRFSDKQTEINFNSNTVSDLSRRHVSFGQGPNMPNNRKNIEIKPSNTKVMQLPNTSKRFSSFTRHNGILHRINSECASLYETNTTTSTSFLETVQSKPQFKCPFTQHLKSHLIWWQNSANTLKGRSLQPSKMNIIMTTDASKTGYGGFIGNQIFQGRWSQLETKLHINLLEMKAVYLTLKHFIHQLKGQSVLFRCDNTTVVQYINKQGGTKSPQLCYQTWDLLNLAIQHQIYLKSAHIIGKTNILADQLSRTKIRPTEWALKKTVVQKIFQIWGHPLIDLFASIENRQTEIFCSWTPHPQALALDALTISWDRMFAYAYPPICLIPKILQYMRQFRCQIILIALNGPGDIGTQIFYSCQ